jgi:hypothetical protein
VERCVQDSATLFGSSATAAAALRHVILVPDQHAVITKILEHRVRDGRYQAHVVYGAKGSKCWKDAGSLDPDAQTAMLQTKLVSGASKRRTKQSDTSIRMQKKRQQQLQSERRKADPAQKARKSAENKRAYQRRKQKKLALLRLRAGNQNGTAEASAPMPSWEAAWLLLALTGSTPPPENGRPLLEHKKDGGRKRSAPDADTSEGRHARKKSRIWPSADNSQARLEGESLRQICHSSPLVVAE